MKVELDLSNYVTKIDLKIATGVDMLRFAKKIDLANVKSEVARFDIGKLDTTPVDLEKLCDAAEK